MSEMFERLSKLSPQRLALLAMELQERLDVAEAAVAAPSAGPEPVAVIGMGCRLPGASNPDEYWEMLRDWRRRDHRDPTEPLGTSTSTTTPTPTRPARSPTRWAGTLDDVDLFEPQMFGISPP